MAPQMNMEFNLQTALSIMEDRIRDDVRSAIADVKLDIRAAVGDVRMVALAARDVADDAQREGIENKGRIVSLEEKADWGAWGFGAGFLALCGVAWRFLTSAPHS